MKANLSVPMIPHETYDSGLLTYETMVDVKIDYQSIQIFFNEDLKQDEPPLFARSVFVEFDDNNLVKVHVYPFDQDEPVNVNIGLDGEYLVETP